MADAEYARGRRAVLHAQGRCIECGEKSDRPASRCTVCHGRAVAAVRRCTARRRARGVCTQCGRNPARRKKDGTLARRCDACQAHNTACKRAERVKDPGG